MWGYGHTWFHIHLSPWLTPALSTQVLRFDRPSPLSSRRSFPLGTALWTFVLLRLLNFYSLNSPFWWTLAHWSCCSENAFFGLFAFALGLHFCTSSCNFSPSNWYRLGKSLFSMQKNFCCYFDSAYRFSAQFLGTCGWCRTWPCGLSSSVPIAPCQL